MKNGVKKRAGNMVQLIYDQLRADILSGTLAPGTPLSQLAIAKTSGTSCGPVREALRRLQQDQFVVARANHRFSIAAFDISDLEAVLSLQLAEITLAIRVSVPFLTDGEIEHLARCVELMDQTAATDRLRWEDGYRDFTLTIVQHTGRRIQSLIDRLLDDAQRHRKTTLESLPSMYSGGPEFRGILEAARVRNGELASSRYAKFMSRVSMLILAGIAPHYDASRLRGYVLALGSYDAEDVNKLLS